MDLETALKKVGCALERQAASLENIRENACPDGGLQDDAAAMGCLVDCKLLVTDCALDDAAG
jgi:hypothetical protein